MFREVVFLLTFILATSFYHILATSLQLFATSHSRRNRFYSIRGPNCRFSTFLYYQLQTFTIFQRFVIHDDHDQMIGNQLQRSHEYRFSGCDCVTAHFIPNPFGSHGWQDMGRRRRRYRVVMNERNGWYPVFRPTTGVDGVTCVKHRAYYTPHGAPPKTRKKPIRIGCHPRVCDVKVHPLAHPSAQSRAESRSHRSTRFSHADRTPQCTLWAAGPSGRGVNGCDDYTAAARRRRRAQWDQARRDDKYVRNWRDGRTRFYRCGSRRW